VTDRLLTAAQLAERWQVPTSHVYRLAREGRIPTVELGRYRRWRLDQVEAFELGADTVSTTDSDRDATAIAPRPYP
jgi:excisionase family DNA binding protein